MRLLATSRTAAAATVVAAGTLGLTAPALAQPHATVTTRTITVPVTVATSIKLPACAPGTTASFGSATPALPDGAIGAVFPFARKNVVKLAGVWPVPGIPAFSLTIDCSDGTTRLATVRPSPPGPELTSALGVGAGTTGTLLDQLSGDYNTTLSTNSTASRLYSFDAVNPDAGTVGDSITKLGCQGITRPDGAVPGLTALTSSQVSLDINCVDFARADVLNASSDLQYVTLAGDAVTWAHQATTNAPATLTAAQLQAIYQCTVTNWNQVGGRNGTIRPFLPSAGSGTRAFFLSAINAVPGGCVSDDNGNLQENDGADSVLQSPNAIVPYSAGDWIAQRFRSAACSASAPACSATPPCAPAAGQNPFGCDTHGTMVLGEINGAAPTTGTGLKTVISPSFPATFSRTLYDVVPFDGETADHIPGSEIEPPGGLDLEPIFGAASWLCTSAAARTDIKNYGFLPLATCGT